MNFYVDANFGKQFFQQHRHEIWLLSEFTHFECLVVSLFIYFLPYLFTSYINIIPRVSIM